MHDFLLDAKSGWVGYKHELTRAPLCRSVSMHMHSRYELIHFLAGDATHVVEDRCYKLRAGDLILLHPMKYHFIQIDSSADYERFIVGFDEELMGEGIGELIEGLPEVINVSDAPDVLQVFDRMRYYRTHLSDADMKRLFPSLVTELIYSVTIAARGESVRRATQINPILTDAIAYINENLLTLKSISEIAEHLFITEGYLFHLFKKELKETPRRYVTDKRLLRAQTMIQGGERPSDVCFKCGFADYATFYRNYKQLFKRSPSDDAVT